MIIHPARNIQNRTYLYKKEISFCAKKQQSAPDGKNFFTTKEGATAIKTNVFVQHMLKNKAQENFCDASEEDLKILKSKDYDAASKRAKWFNPDDGKVYYILKKSQDENGDYSVRILSQSGKFIKEAKIKPQTVVIADNFSGQEMSYIKNGDFILPRIPNIAHGRMVSRFAEVNNPFANYKLLDLQKVGQSKSDIEIFESLLEKKNDANVLNYSIADPMPTAFYELFKSKSPSEIADIAQNIVYSFKDDEDIASLFVDIEDCTYVIKLLNKISQNGCKVFISSGNQGVDCFNFLLLAKGTEGVGSLSENGMTSSFSSSRKIPLTKHYELGEYKITRTKDGISYTGGAQTDYICNLDEIFRIDGKKHNEYNISEEEFNVAMKYKEKDDVEFYKLFDKWSSQNRILRGDLVCKMFDDEFTHSYDNLYISMGDWIPYTKDQNGILQAHFEPLCGTSFSSPIRAARYALNKSMEGILQS